jgi:predicted chitinase
MMTRAQLASFLGSQGRAAIWHPLLVKWLPIYGMAARNRFLDFMAQVGHESVLFRHIEEIASGAAYEGREDLGNTEPGDGVKYKGRGPLQITGKANYRACSLYLFKDERLVENPELLEDPETGLRAALWYWKTNGLHIISDKPESWTRVVHHRDGTERTYTRFQYLTLRINGGLNGLAERMMLRARAAAIFI